MRAAPRIYPLGPRRAPEAARRRRRRQPLQASCAPPDCPADRRDPVRPPAEAARRGPAQDKAKSVTRGKYHSGSIEIEPTRIADEAEKF